MDDVQTLDQFLATHLVATVTPPSVASAFPLLARLLQCLPGLEDGRVSAELDATAGMRFLERWLDEPAVLWLPTSLGLQHLRRVVVTRMRQAAPEGQAPSDELLELLVEHLEDVKGLTAQSRAGGCKLELSGCQLLGPTLVSVQGEVGTEEGKLKTQGKLIPAGGELENVFADFARQQTLGVEELQLAAWRLGVVLTQEETVATMATVDTDKSGKFCFEEFKVWWEKIGSQSGGALRSRCGLNEL